MKSITVRTISGIIYVALLIGCILWCKYSFFGLFMLLTGGMTYEFLRMSMGTDYKFCQIMAVLTSCAFFALLWAIRAFPAIPDGIAFLIMIPVGTIMVNSLYVKDKSEFGKFANVYASFVYIALPMAVFNFVVMDVEGNYCGILLILFFVLVWMSDVGAYLFGMSLGQKFGKKLFESISPKKSWIGFWGGMAFAIAFSLAFYYFGIWETAGIKDFTWYHSIGLAVCMHIAGVYGDLFESQWKRHYSVKDSGKIIPGHGGLMDRLDSSIFAIPVGMLYLTLFNYVITL